MNNANNDSLSPIIKALNVILTHICKKVLLANQILLMKQKSL